MDGWTMTSDLFSPEMTRYLMYGALIIGGFILKSLFPDLTLPFLPAPARKPAPAPPLTPALLAQATAPVNGGAKHPLTDVLLKFILQGDYQTASALAAHMADQTGLKVAAKEGTGPAKSA